MLKRALSASLLVLLVACGGGELTPPVKVSTPKPGFVQQTVHARLTMKVRGAQTLDLDTKTKLTIVEIIGGKTPVVTWFVSVSAGEQVTLDDGRTMLFTADLSPGLYRGKGTYKLQDKGAVKVSGQESPLGSASYVSFLDIGPPPKLARYDVLKEACTMTVAEQVVSGSVTCPALADAEGETISASWSWERT